MNTPQEVEVWVILPEIRRLLAKYLKQEGLKQKEVANLLGLTIPAVSQYLHNKRAKKITFDSDVKEIIKESAKNIVSKKTKPKYEIQKILKYVNSNKIICDACNEFCNTNDNCDICYSSEVI